MSKPQNILGKFDTYAYHHILMVCNNTAAAEALASTDEITTYQHPRDRKRYKARDIGTIDGGKYVTLIDGTTDARFFITDVSWTNYIAADSVVGEDSTAQSTTMSTDGEMEIIEPLGASFLNRLTDICDELDSDPVGLVFLLKTIFIGRNSNGTTEMISTVRPLMFVAFDITAVFDSSGAKYKLEFVGLTNGAGKLPQPQKIFEGLNFKMDPTSLQKTLNKLEDTVNKKYKQFKAKAIVDFAATLKASDENNALNKANKFLIENYRDVKYKIILEDVYGKDSRYKAGDNEHIRLADDESATVINYGPDVTVEDILNRVMASSDGVYKDSQGKGTDRDNNFKRKKYIYKIISTIRSTAKEYVVEYHIKRFLQAQSLYSQQEENGVITPLPGQSIEFDYIFTGKNVDIKNFDIKMEMGMAFFQIAATTDNYPSQKNIGAGMGAKTTHIGGSSSVANKGGKTRSSTPLFLGTTLKNQQMRNTKRPIESAGFQALLDRHASLENISASMVIYGNPQLLDEMTILPSELSKKIAQTEDPKEGQTINPRWVSSPTLVKVNIKMPVDANDVNTEYEDFWYTGWYNLQVVENKFSDGVFLQELGMFSIPIENQLQEIPDAPELTGIQKTGLWLSGVVNAGQKLLRGDFTFGDDDDNAPQRFDKESLTAQQKRRAVRNKALALSNEFKRGG